MKASRKKHHQRWAHRLLKSVMCLAFFGFFAVVWQVHAFDLQKALPKVVDKASTTPVPQQVAPATATVAQPSANAPSKPDRWSDGDVVSALSSFYQTIITMMGVLLGVIGILAVLTLRFLSKSAAEDMAHESAKEAMRHYLETRQFGDNVEFALQETGLADQLERLAKDIEKIKLLLRSQRKDQADNEDVEGEVIPKTDGEND
ncbi:hypothetical protein [Xanthomonas sacchari]|uniref:hypothetical protein n=1 Tax=Xanthomonas sacchari TaxID=56458 RepID=UPI002254BF41|nr:hypothetical protein [Xanthomonas sacchari]